MFSVLNPEAPEFRPLMTNAVEEGYGTSNKSIRTSNTYPIGPSYDIYKTYTNFGIVTYKIRENVVEQSCQIAASEVPDLTAIRSENPEENTEKVADVTDNFVDRINIHIDTTKGVNKPNERFLDGINQVNVSSWNNSPVIAKITVGSATLIGGKNIPRPQINFKYPVDNSYNLWVPKIFDKPNNFKPLALNIIYNENGEAVSYEHPYSVELDLYNPPAHFIAPDAAPPEFPPPLSETPLTIIDTEQKMDDLVAHLAECHEIAVDVEHHSYRSYQGITCLIQISTYTGGDFIIDTIAVREHVHKLNYSFTDPKKLKIFHGAESDVKWLQRDFGVYIVGMFDTYHAAKLLQLPLLSLKQLLTTYCQVATDKKYQTADWRMRPLSEEMIKYARTDTHYLLYLWRVMKSELYAMGQGLPNLLLSAFESSRQTSGVIYNKPVMDDVCHMPLYIRSKKSFNTQQLAALKMLYKWRDSMAREMDEGPSYLIPNHMLLALAETLPREVQGVAACCARMPPFVKMNILQIHRMILSCRQLPSEPQLYQMPAAVRDMQQATVGNALPADLGYNVHDLQHIPDCTEEINLDMALACLNKNNVEPDADRVSDVAPDAPALAPQPDVAPDAPALAPRDANLECGVVSTLNVDAKMFIPPYDRYRAYRALAQEDELKDFRDKEAKVAALSKGNELIKTEVLEQIQKQKDAAEASAQLLAESQTEPDEQESPETQDTNEKCPKKHEKSHRKRKIEKLAAVKTADKKAPQKPQQQNNDANVKAFQYKNANYKKFYTDSEKEHKQPKMKFKKP